MKHIAWCKISQHGHDIIQVRDWDWKLDSCRKGGQCPYVGPMKSEVDFPLTPIIESHHHGHACRPKDERLQGLPSSLLEWMKKVQWPGMELMD